MDPLATRPTLLSRVRDAHDTEAWSQFESLYGDLILRYARARGLSHCDAEDIRQVVLLGLSRSLGGFLYSPQRGRFRDYLGRVVRNAVFRWRSRENPAPAGLGTWDGDIESPADAEGGRDDPAWEREWMNHHFRQAMSTIRRTSEARTVEVFDRLMRGESVEALAAAYGMSPGAIYQIKNRVGQRLKDLIAEQVREEDQPGA